MNDPHISFSFRELIFSSRMYLQLVEEPSIVYTIIDKTLDLTFKSKTGSVDLIKRTFMSRVKQEEV